MFSRGHFKLQKICDSVILSLCAYKDDGARLLPVMPRNNTSANRHTQKYIQFCLNIVNCLLQGQLSIGTDCSERLWSIYPQRYLKHSSTLPGQFVAVKSVLCREIGSSEIPSNLHSSDSELLPTAVKLSTVSAQPNTQSQSYSYEY